MIIPPQGVLDKIFNGVQQVFQKIPSLTGAAGGVTDVDAEDCRFEYFKDHVLTPILRIRQKRTLIVTPSYISYVRSQE